MREPPPRSLRHLFARINPPTTLLLVFAGAFSVILYSYLLGEARVGFSVNRILGWDTLVYAYTAQETRIQGIAWLFQFWGHPNAYVVVLAGAAVLLGDTVQSSHLVPIVMIALLSFASGYLARRMGGLGAAFLAVALTATSFATFRLFVDLHRALLAFALVTVLIALGSSKSLSTLKLGRKGILSLILVFIVAFSEFEIYLALLATTVLTVALTRDKGRWYLPILWSLLPGLVFVLTPGAQRTFGFLVAIAPSVSLQPLPLDLAFLYLTAIASLPFAIIGAIALLRTRKSDGSQTSIMLLSWVATMLLVLVVFVVLLPRISSYRPIILLHIPVLAAIGLERSTRFIWKAVRERQGHLAYRHFLRIKPDERVWRVGFVLMGSSLVLLSGIQLERNADRFLAPVVPEDLYDRLVESSLHLDRSEWKAPIYLILNLSQVPILTAIRYQLGVLNGPTYFYYGDLNFVPWTVIPQRVNPNIRDDFSQLLTLCFEFRVLERALDPAPLDLLSHPIVIVQPDLFPRSLSPRFDRFQVGDGIYVIPPNALTIETFYTWELLPEEDSFGLGEGYPVARDWSRSEQVVEIYTSEGYEISFPYYFPIPGTYTISVHLFDFPEMDVNTTTPLSPLEMYVGETLIDTLEYRTVRPIWWNATAFLERGFNVITLRTARDDLPFRLSLDLIVVTAEDAPGAS